MDEGRESRRRSRRPTSGPTTCKHANPKIFEDSLAGALLRADDVASLVRFLIAGVAKHNPELGASGRTGRPGSGLRSAGSSSCWRGRASPRSGSRKRCATAPPSTSSSGRCLDPFALRRPDLRGAAARHRDRPTRDQAFMRGRIRDAGLRAAHQPALRPGRPREGKASPRSVADTLRSVAPAFFSWLGVTMYLTDAAIRGRRCAPCGRWSAPAASWCSTTSIRAVFDTADPSPARGPSLRDCPARRRSHDLRLRPAALEAELAEEGFRLFGGPGPGSPERALLQEPDRRASPDGHGPSRPRRRRVACVRERMSWKRS